MRFSVSTQSFYDDNYEKNAVVNDLPSDVQAIDDGQYASFLNAINSSRVVYLVADEFKISQPRPDKYYSWDITSKAWAMTDAAAVQKSIDLIADAELRRTTLLSAAGNAISPLQDVVDLGIATDVEITLLTEWKKYRVLLMRIDTSKAPDIKWPTPSVEQAS
ncbi:tail fiber assembly protein [Pantoea stewartii]|uniref:tail fiber assembly protein n=1 Tax=Pantoea stewartii TaxID=66269 RepID=UPI0013DE562A|nr:tail fiber assembly protein [Pantoea stewartii]QIE97370.1 tail fiber assembly protein [Pantoea stewartii]